MDLGLKGKIAVVLGASKGMGRASAWALGREGCTLVLCARGEQDLVATAHAIEEERLGPVLARICDVTRDEDRQKSIEDTVKMFGRIDILVNNCGGPKPGRFQDTQDPKKWQEAFERSLMQVVRWTHAVVPHMKGWGRIVNIVSTSVKQPIDGLLLSNSIRPGVIGFSKSASRDLAPMGITINSVLPGSIRTDRTVELAQERAAREKISIEQALQDKIREIPAGRLGDPMEVGALVAYLCSQQAAYITGTSIVIDGGLTRSI